MLFVWGSACAKSVLGCEYQRKGEGDKSNKEIHKRRIHMWIWRRPYNIWKGKEKGRRVLRRTKKKGIQRVHVLFHLQGQEALVSITISIPLRVKISFSIDATKDDTTVGRMINHSRKYPNIVPQIVSIDETPHIVFFARMDISCGAELLYDYGDRSSAAIYAHPWLGQ